MLIILLMQVMCLNSPMFPKPKIDLVPSQPKIIHPLHRIQRTHRIVRDAAEAILKALAEAVAVEVNVVGVASVVDEAAHIRAQMAFVLLAVHPQSLPKRRMVGT